MTEKKMNETKAVEMMKQVKTENGRMFSQDVDTLNRCFSWILKNVFAVSAKGFPVITITAPRCGDKPVYIGYSPDLQQIKDKSCQALIVNVNPSTLSSVKKTLEALAYAGLHYIALLSDKKLARKKTLQFKELAERFGFIAEKTSDINAGYEKITFTAKLWEQVKPYSSTIAFNFEGVERDGAKKNEEKKEKFFYVHPNGLDFVESDNGTLKLFVDINGQYKPMIRDVDGTLMQAIRSRRRELKRANPQPEARQRTFA